MAKVLFIGLDAVLADQLAPLVKAHEFDIEAKPANVRPFELRGADVVFASGDDAHYRELLSAVRADNTLLPYIVVSRLPEVSQWIDALEAGATDYCAAPFESRQIEWLMRAVSPAKNAQRASAA